MRILNCSSKGCILKPKKMARASQTGSGGVVQQNTPTLVALKSLRSSTAKSSKGRVSKTKRVSKAKPVQTGKGRRTRRPKVSVVSSTNVKTSKRRCAGKKGASRSKTSKKRTTKKNKK